MVKRTSSSGKSYEHGCYIRLFKVFGETHSFVKSPWILWTSSTGNQYACEPDILMFDHDARKVWIIECKSWNYGEAISDLKQLYMHVIKCMYPEYEVRGMGCSPKKGTLIKNLDLDWSIDEMGEIQLVRIPGSKK